jgi:glycerate kinase
MVSLLDKALRHYAAKIKEYTGKDIENVQGSGAAGGAGAGLMTFLDAKLVKGIDLIMQCFNLEDKIKSADYVFTGEGSIDNQTVYGKTITGVTRLANQYNKPVIAFAGKIGDTKLLCQQLGLTSLFCILPAISKLEDALQSGEFNLENTVFSVVQLINNFNKTLNK